MLAADVIAYCVLAWLVLMVVVAAWDEWRNR